MQCKKRVCSATRGEGVQRKERCAVRRDSDNFSYCAPYTRTALSLYGVMIDFIILTVAIGFIQAALERLEKCHSNTKDYVLIS